MARKRRLLEQGRSRRLFVPPPPPPPDKNRPRSCSPCTRRERARLCVCARGTRRAIEAFSSAPYLGLQWRQRVFRPRSLPSFLPLTSFFYFFFFLLFFLFFFFIVLVLFLALRSSFQAAARPRAEHRREPERREITKRKRERQSGEVVRGCPR